VCATGFASVGSGLTFSHGTDTSGSHPKRRVGMEVGSTRP
jgi:hypothetical protein